MLEKFLKKVVIITVGKQAEEIVPLLDSKKHVNEFIIAKKLDITINQTRNILYKLSDNGLVSSIRKKDKKKGWYTYFWKIEKLKTLDFLKSIEEKKKEQIHNQIKSRETKQFYICETCRIEFNEENALLHDFTCNECGNTFTLKDNTKLLKELKKNLTKVEKELELIEEEIDKEKIEREKIIQKEEKAIAKKILKNKLAKKKLVEKKPVKKVIKKKAVKKKLVKKIVKKKISVKKPVKKIVKKKAVEKKIVKKKITKKK